MQNRRLTGPSPTPAAWEIQAAPIEKSDRNALARFAQPELVGQFVPVEAEFECMQSKTCR